MKKRHYVFGVLAALSLFTLASCGDAKTNEPEPTPETPEVVDYSSYQVSQQEFNEATNKMIYDNYVWIEKNYYNSISTENLSATNTFTRNDKWIELKQESSSPLTAYYYVDNDKVTCYYSSDGKIHSLPLDKTGLNSVVDSYMGQCYSGIAFKEEDKTYYGTNISINFLTNYNILMDLKCNFKDKKLIHMEAKMTMTSDSGEQTVIYNVSDCQYGNFKVTVPQEVLDYHNEHYNK